MDLVNIEKDISKLSIEQLTQLDLELRGLDQEPVPIKQFLDDDYYLGRYFSSGFREYWYDPLQTIFSQPGKSNYFLVFLSGSIGRGKSTTAMAACLYNLYSLLCYKDPQSEFNLVANDKILFAFMNATQSLADKALLGKYQGMLDASPYFQRVLADFYKKTKHKKIPTDFPKNIGVVSGSRITHTLGLNIFCITGDTKVPLLDGRTLTMFEIQNEFNQGKKLYTYSLDIENKTQVPGLISNFFDNGVAPVYRVWFDNGKYLDCTENHKFLTRDNEYKPLNELSVGSAIMPLRKDHDRYGYEYWINPYTQESRFIHHIVTNFNYDSDCPYHVHHKNENKKDNSPDNLVILKSEYHKSYHTKKFWGSLTSERKKQILQKKSKGALRYLQNLTSEELVEKKQQLSFVSKQGWANYSEEEKQERVRKNVIAHTLAREYKRYQNGQDIRWLDNYKNYFESYEELVEKVKSYNHKIVKIEYLGERRVFDLEIQGFHNFAIDADVFIHNSAIISEAAFGIVNNQMMNLFDSVMARQQSRFMQNGKSAGVIWVDSSEGDKGSELAILRDKYRGKPGVYIDTGPLWQVKFEDYTDCRFFYLFTGNEKFQPRILDPYESQEDRELLNTGPFIVVPEVHRSAFEADIMRAMRDLAGIPTSSSFSLFRNLEKLHAAMTYQPIFEDIVRLEFDDQYDQITDHCQYLDYFANLPYASHPRFLHLDLAISGDKLGIACCFIMGMKEVSVNLMENTKAGTSLMPRVCYDFAFSIEAKSGQQIPLDKIRIFLSWLNNNKVSIGGVSADSFNSANILQSVQHMGFYSQVLSVDRGSDNYLSFRNAIYEERIILPRNKLLEKELINLEMSADMKKVDHPSAFPDGTVGSKDCADACCGSYNLAVLRSAETAYLMMPESKPIQPVTNTQLLTGAIKNLWGKKPVPDPYEEYLRRQEENFTPQKNPFNFWNKPV